MLIDILKAFLVVGVVGLFLGVLLAIFSHFFRVAEDERTKKIRGELPGINCGACGFKGCDDYAAAISQGKARSSLCIPGGDSTAAVIASILGIEAEDTKEMVAFVHCNGNCEATSKKAIYNGVQSCRAAVTAAGGPNTCRFGCMGFGDCADVCPANAICIRDGIAHVDPTLCIGCGLCAKTCPKKIISLVPQIAKTAVMCNSEDKGADAKKACSNACIACKKCEKSCPEGAISVQNNLARIDYDKCTACGICTNVCPTKCIKPVSFTA